MIDKGERLTAALVLLHELEEAALNCGLGLYSECLMYEWDDSSCVCLVCKTAAKVNAIKAEVEKLLAEVTAARTAPDTPST